jgi:MoaA/NifB/PqqE/SkfB family radical SAM enzyme|tara:strand:- start:1111 stop:1320 length:210 start_codon:yes stop_codon:yes gene_type:complete
LASEFSIDIYEAKQFIRGLTAFDAPVLMFPEREALLRKDLLELTNFTKRQGLRLIFSTNSTQMPKEIAR